MPRLSKEVHPAQSKDELKSVLIAEMFYLSIDKALWEKEISLDEKKGQTDPQKSSYQCAQV